MKKILIIAFLAVSYIAYAQIPNNLQILKFGATDADGNELYSDLAKSNSNSILIDPSNKTIMIYVDNYAVDILDYIIIDKSDTELYFSAKSVLTKTSRHGGIKLKNADLNIYELILSRGDKYFEVFSCSPL